MDIEKLIQKNELNGLEVKTSLSEWKECVQTLAAFAWKEGGKVVFGVSKSGKLMGVDIGKGTLENLANRIKLNTDPKLYPEITVEKVKGKNVVIVKTKKVSDEPILAFGRPYKRIGNSTHRMSREEYKRVIFKANRDKLRFDNQVCRESILDDIDESKLRWFLRTAKRERGLAIPIDIPIMNALTRLDMIRDGKLTNAAVLLFGKNPQKFFLQSETKCVKMLTLKFVKPYDLYFGYEGTLFDQVDEAVIFVMENTRRPLVYGKGITTERPEEIPEKVIREAIVNAIVHRDYRSPSKTQVRIFPDRIEFWNMGLLPKGLSIDDLKKPHISLPRNPLLFKQFYRAGYVEDVGGGTVDIIEKCMAKGLPEPTYEEKQGGLVLTIWRDIYTPEYLDELELNERQRKAIEHLKINGKITALEYREIFDISKTTTHRDIKDMISKQIIIEQGSGKATYYTLTKPKYDGNGTNGTKMERTMKRLPNNQEKRGFFTKKHLQRLDLNERQKKALKYLKKHEKITNRKYRELSPEITDRTALNDLTDLVKKGILAKKGKTKDAHYVLRIPK